MMIQPCTTMIKILIFRNYSVFNEPHFLKKLQRNLRVLFLINVWWVDTYCTLTLFNLHQMYHWKTEESEYIAGGSTQLCVSRFHSCTAIPPPQKNTAQNNRYIYLGWKRLTHHSWYGYIEAFKIAHARQTCLCLPMI